MRCTFTGALRATRKALKAHAAETALTMASATVEFSPLKPAVAVAIPPSANWLMPIMAEAVPTAARSTADRYRQNRPFPMIFSWGFIGNGRKPRICKTLPLHPCPLLAWPWRQILGVIATLLARERHPLTRIWGHLASTN